MKKSSNEDHCMLLELCNLRDECHALALKRDEVKDFVIFTGWKTLYVNILQTGKPTESSGQIWTTWDENIRILVFAILVLARKRDNVKGECVYSGARMAMIGKRQVKL